MRNQKKIKQEIRTKIMNIVSAPPETERGTGYLKLTDEEIDKIVDLFKETLQRFIEETNIEEKPKIKGNNIDEANRRFGYNQAVKKAKEKQTKWLKDNL